MPRAEHPKPQTLRLHPEPGSPSHFGPPLFALRASPQEPVAEEAESLPKPKKKVKQVGCDQAFSFCFQGLVFFFFFRVLGFSFFGFSFLVFLGLGFRF